MGAAHQKQAYMGGNGRPMLTTNLGDREAARPGLALASAIIVKVGFRLIALDASLCVAATPKRRWSTASKSQQ